ncbi:MAG: hypothetical protein HY364_03505 [Candidatus Aenigmarchaeota archaeon]|nr:hypothetical protein [Candidatus Aenigmarchaeota archaeon]
MGKATLGMAAVFLMLPFAYALQLDVGSVEITPGGIVEKVISQFPYGGIKGTAKAPVGGTDLIPDSVWLLPGNYTMEQFKYIELLSLPSALNLTGNCKTSVYYNDTASVHAYKVSVKEDGSYCLAATEGTYRVVVEY